MKPSIEKEKVRLSHRHAFLNPILHPVAMNWEDNDVSVDGVYIFFLFGKWNGLGTTPENERNARESRGNWIIVGVKITGPGVV